MKLMQVETDGRGGLTSSDAARVQLGAEKRRNEIVTIALLPAGMSISGLSSSVCICKQLLGRLFTCVTKMPLWFEVLFSFAFFCFSLSFPCSTFAVVLWHLRGTLLVEGF